MTKRDLQLIADCIWASSKLLKLSNQQKEVLINQFAKSLSWTSGLTVGLPKFNSEEFIKACQ